MRKILIISCLFIPVLVFSQIKRTGTPIIRNYHKSTYKAGTQNWSITQDEKGFMYFANNEGVVIFDGVHWDRIPVSSSKPIRSIFTSSDGDLYVGLLNDFGIILPNEFGIYSFKSLRDLLPSEIYDFDEIWKIYEITEGIVFQTFEYVFILIDGEISIIRPNTRYQFSFLVNGRLFFQEPGYGVFEYTNKMLFRVAWSDKFNDKEIREIIDIGDGKLLICTNGEGLFVLEGERIYKWNSQANSFVEEYKLFSASKIIGDNIAFGTILKGVIISDLEGNIIQHLDKDNGLQNNTILSLYSDKDGNLWLGLDNGIDFIEINSPITYFTNFDDIGTGYVAKVFKNKLYLGTNQGLFVRDFIENSYERTNFELVKNTAGQVWSLDIFDGQLICGHNSGTFLINDNEAKNISSEEGAWKYIPLRNHPDLLLGGHYNGLALLKNGPEGWVFDKKIKGFNQSCRFLHEGENKTIWISHGSLGIYKVLLNDKIDSVLNYKLYNSQHGLPSDEQNIVFSYGKEIIISTINGLYVYNEGEDIFQPSVKLNTVFNVDGRLKTFETDDMGNIWFIAQNESGILRFNQDSTYTKITAPFKSLDGKYINEFEFIYSYNRDNIFFGIGNGYAHYSSSLPKSYSSPYNSYITKVELSYLDSILYYTHINDSSIEYHFPFKKNAFRFYFTSPFYELPEELQFSHYLENYSDSWSEWSSSGFKDFTNLREGEYTFMLKSINIYDIESSIAEFRFNVDPPWHRSRTAYYLFSGIIILIGLLGVKYLRYRISKSKKREREKHKKEMKEKEEQFKLQSVISEKEIIKLRNEKLRADMIHRDKELANQTMNIIQKNKFLSKLKEELRLIEKNTDDPQLRTKILIINRRLDKEIDNKTQDKIFKNYFEEVHEDFFKRLKFKYPKLSPRDLSLCAYIKMNLTTKEIAALQNISSRGVEINRYRLRKKLNLSRETNLSTFLSNI